MSSCVRTAAEYQKCSFSPLSAEAELNGFSSSRSDDSPLSSCGESRVSGAESDPLASLSILPEIRGDLIPLSAFLKGQCTSTVRHPSGGELMIGPSYAHFLRGECTTLSGKSNVSLLPVFFLPRLLFQHFNAPSSTFPPQF